MKENSNWGTWRPLTSSRGDARREQRLESCFQGTATANREKFSHILFYIIMKLRNLESSGLSRRGEQKGGNKGRVLTFVANSWFVRKLSEGAKSRHNLKRLKLVFF